MVFPALYNGPLNYFARLVHQSEVVLEQHDSYLKQSYRTRCMIMGPNNVMSLSIPVIHQHGKKTLLKDVKIDYDSPWNRVHWKSIVASYASSPFFEYLADELAPYYEKQFSFLIDLNQELLEFSLQQLGKSPLIKRSESFTEISGDKDPRYFIHPKKNQAELDPGFQPEAYHQVFAERLGFRSNLSILDLLFNVGPDALSYLLRSLRT